MVRAWHHTRWGQPITVWEWKVTWCSNLQKMKLHILLNKAVNFWSTCSSPKSFYCMLCLTDWLKRHKVCLVTSKAILCFCLQNILLWALELLFLCWPIHQSTSNNIDFSGHWHRLAIQESLPNVALYFCIHCFPCFLPNWFLTKIYWVCWIFVNSNKLDPVWLCIFGLHNWWRNNKW